MHDMPLLFSVGQQVRLGKLDLQVLGHARFSYGRGSWDEFWCLEAGGKGYWVSVDEGDIVVQVPIKSAPLSPEMSVGEMLQHQAVVYRVVERGAGECVALRGQFDEDLAIGETFAYANAQSDDGRLISCEVSDGETLWFSGKWYDPFEVQVS
jgi:hypothetical protein